MYHINREEIKMQGLQYNGYIVQRKSKSEYNGIEGDNWYLNYCSNNPFFEDFYSETIDKVWENSDYVDCCADELYIKQYIDESRKLGIEFRILLCATCRSSPIIDKMELGKVGEVLGYDLAYSGGSYYSCVLNDIISGRIREFKEIVLNKNGLFSTYEEAKNFSQIRNNMMVSDSPYTFEQGDFIIYEITEIIIN